MTAENKTINQFIAENKLTMEAKPVSHNPNMDSETPMDHWQCEIAKDGGEPWLTFFSMGIGHKSKSPELADVLDCLASDAAGFDNAQDFEDWASEYGYSEDSRKAEAIYNTIDRQADELKQFLGDDAYSDMLWNTERE